MTFVSIADIKCKNALLYNSTSQLTCCIAVYLYITHSQCCKKDNFIFIYRSKLSRYRTNNTFQNYLGIDKR